MGFYDQGYKKPKRRSDRSIWPSSIIGAIIGGLVVLLMLPALSNMGIISYTGTQPDSEVTSHSASNPTHTPAVEQSVQVNVTSDITEAVENVSDAIVGVINVQQGGLDFFNRESESVDSGIGSGIVFEIDGDRAYIVTNQHVIENAQEVDISLEEGERVPAELIGADVLTDLAVLSIDAEAVDTVAEFGDSDALRTGEPAIAIGNPLGLQFSGSVTQGIISATERSIPIQTSEGEWELNVIQTDAAINQGNSGGALVNVQGQVVGVNSLKIGQFGVEGLGFAIPINDAIPVISSLIEHGEIQRPFMGIGLVNLSDVPSQHWQETLNLPSGVNKGIVVTAVEPGSPAHIAELNELDVIVEMDGNEIGNTIDLRQFLYNETEVGATVEVRFYRDGLPQTVEIELTETMS